MVVPQKTGRTVPNRGRIGTAMLANNANLTEEKYEGSLSVARMISFGLGRKTS